MVKNPVPRPTFLVLALVLMVTLCACGDTLFQNNPHGASLVFQLTPTTKAPRVPSSATHTPPHFSPFGFGASLAALAAHYGQPTDYTAPPLYAFQDGNDAWPKGSLIIVTLKNGRAVEFSYDPGTDHPMTYQEAQDFAVQLLPDDVQGPKTVQQEDDHAGKCLAKTYHSTLLTTLFTPNDFISPDGRDTANGTVTLNLFPNAPTTTGATYENSDNVGFNRLLSTNTVNSVLLNLGSKPSC